MFGSLDMWPRFARFCAVGIAVLFAPALASAATPADQQIIHLLNRMAFGPTGADVGHVKAVGIDRYVEEQLRPET
ncbi:MAG TPA: hypothetical protein VM782_18225, partial [Stellaceae bacterium]|nr:hypothetical protein [Stellaceae bacterium]